MHGTVRSDREEQTSRFGPGDQKSWYQRETWCAIVHRISKGFGQVCLNIKWYWITFLCLWRYDWWFVFAHSFFRRIHHKHLLNYTLLVLQKIPCLRVQSRKGFIRPGTQRSAVKAVETKSCLPTSKPGKPFVITKSFFWGERFSALSKIESRVFFGSCLNCCAEGLFLSRTRIFTTIMEMYIIIDV